MKSWLDIQDIGWTSTKKKCFLQDCPLKYLNAVLGPWGHTILRQLQQEASQPVYHFSVWCLVNLLYLFILLKIY